MNKFQADGIDKLTAVYDDEIKALVGRVRAVGDASRDYRSFSGLGSDMDGSVKFIYTIDGTE
jgi:putative membrane protein